ncbi:MAG: DNA-directed RNA polymerase subunit K [Candidatus Nanoarchaeia archaeon]
MVKIELPEDYCTKYEKARLIGARALQISMGAPFLIKISEEELQEMKFNPIDIAKLEFEKGVLNMDIKRKLPHEK